MNKSSTSIGDCKPDLSIGSEFISAPVPPDAAEILEPFKQHRLKALDEAVMSKMAYAYGANSKRFMRYKDCGSFLAMDIFSHDKTGDIRRQLASANFCGDRFCPLCNHRRAVRMADLVNRKLHAIRRRKAIKFKLVFLTLTVKNPLVGDTAAELKKLARAWQSLSHMKAFKAAFPHGFLRAVEFMGDKTKAGQSHPHYHVLLVAHKRYGKNSDLYIDHDHIVSMWKKALGVDYKPGAWLESVKGKRNKKGKFIPSEVAGSFEVAKYCLTPAAIARMPKDDFKILSEQVRSVQQYSFGGLLRTIEPDDDSELDMGEWTLLGQEFYRWAGQDYQQLRPKDADSPIIPKVPNKPATPVTETDGKMRRPAEKQSPNVSPGDKALLTIEEIAAFAGARLWCAEVQNRLNAAMRPQKIPEPESPSAMPPDFATGGEVGPSPAVT